MNLVIRRKNKSRRITHPQIVLATYILAVFLMFRYVAPDIGTLMLAGVVFLFAMSKSLRFRFELSDAFLMIYALILLFLGILRDDKVIILHNFGVLALQLILKILIQGNRQRWYKKLFLLLMIFGLIHTFAVFSELFNPVLVSRIAATMHVESKVEIGESMVYKSGITNQPGVAAFCICMFLCVCVAGFFQAKKWEKTLLVFFVVSGCAALLLTGKRALFVEAFVCIYYISFLYFAVIRRKGLKLFLFVLFILIALPFIAELPIFSSNVTRLLHGGDAGRMIIYRFLIQSIKSSPIIGVGRDAYVAAMEIGAHNDYLRVLSEDGLMGFVFFFPGVTIPLINSTAAVFKYRDLILKQILDGNRETIMLLLTSIYWQTIILLYALTGNPLNTIEQTTSYFVFTALGLNVVRELRLMKQDMNKTIML